MGKIKITCKRCDSNDVELTSNTTGLYKTLISCNSCNHLDYRESTIEEIKLKLKQRKKRKKK